jgi:hypothetical protein
MISRVALLSILVIFLNWPVSSPAEQRNPVFALTLPGLEWALEINAPGFLVGKRTLGPRGDSVYFFTSNKESNVILSAFLEKAARRGTSKECRDSTPCRKAPQTTPRCCDKNDTQSPFRYI